VDSGSAEKVCTIKAKVADLIGPTRYRTWFGESTRFQLDGGELDVTVANDFVGNWITSNYMPQLVEATRTVVGIEPRVKVRVGEGAPAPAGETVVAAGEPGGRPAGIRRRPIPTARPEGRVSYSTPTLRGELSTFVVGPPNELAYSVASAIVRQPRQSFKHLVFHGGCGLGKTHLLQGVCNGVRRAHADLQWHYLSGEEFTNEFIYAVKFGRIDAFRSRFRSVDVLVIDDIHFLAHKKATQEEFLHTFNAIDASGKTVILSSDRHPRSIATLSEPLINRLIAAMVIELGAPDYATRQEILRRRAQAMSCDLPEDVLRFLAEQITRNVRELEGALYKLVAFSALTKDRVSVELARRVVEDYVTRNRTPECPDIETGVADYFGTTREALHSTSRDRTVTLARGFAMYLVRKHTRLSFPEIGRSMGNKQHSTVLMATRRIQDLLNRDGAVTWKTPLGMRDVPAKDLLEELERRLLRGQDSS
jgi:chromosomal replication initiator protein